MFGIIICKHLHRPLILGLDICKQHGIGRDWSNSGMFILNQKHKILIESGDTHIAGLNVFTTWGVHKTFKTLSVVRFKVDEDTFQFDHFYDVQPNQ